MTVIPIGRGSVKMYDSSGKSEMKCEMLLLSSLTTGQEKLRLRTPQCATFFFFLDQPVPGPERTPYGGVVWILPKGFLQFVASDTNDFDNGLGQKSPIETTKNSITDIICFSNRLFLFSHDSTLKWCSHLIRTEPKYHPNM